MCAMFPDSQIVQRIKPGKTKCMYTCVYGLGMYFYSLLMTQVKASPHYTISFDKSLNTKLQECQMEIIVRYWNAESAEVKVQHFLFEVHAAPKQGQPIQVNYRINL